MFLNAVAGFALLLAALFVFVWSTRQYSLWVRSLIWLLGIALLVGAGETLSPNRDYLALWQVVWWEPATFFKALSDNQWVVFSYYEPLLGVLFVVCLLIAVTALVAFTPGEAVERFMRGLSLAIVGVILGAVLTLALVAIGFDGTSKRAVYVGRLRTEGCDGKRSGPCDVHDGDTILMGDTPIRLLGINAAELDDGGEAARAELIGLVTGKIVFCYLPQGEGKDIDHDGIPDIPRESFGRPLLACKALSEGADPLDLAQALVQAGLARACAYYSHPVDGGDYRRSLALSVADAIKAGRYATKPSCGNGEEIKPLQAS